MSAGLRDKAGTPLAISAALWKFAEKRCGHNAAGAGHALGSVVKHVDRVEAERDGLRAEVGRLKKVLVQAAIPLEVIAAQAAQCAYDELTLGLQMRICDEVIPAIRAALSASAPTLTQPSIALDVLVKRMGGLESLREFECCHGVPFTTECEECGPAVFASAPPQSSPIPEVQPYTLCPDCDQPMLPHGMEKRPDEYDHASGCPREAQRTDTERMDWFDSLPCAVTIYRDQPKADSKPTLRQWIDAAMDTQQEPSK